jgi:hypothetical protein
MATPPFQDTSLAVGWVPVQLLSMEPKGLHSYQQLAQVLLPSECLQSTHLASEQDQQLRLQLSQVLQKLDSSELITEAIAVT